MNEKKNPERFGKIHPDVIPLNRETQSMDTKVHFLIIPDQEFAKILTYPSLGYLAQITSNIIWHHFPGCKITISNEYNAELINQLLIHNISYERSLLHFNFTI